MYRVGPIWSFKAGYQMWRAGFDQGEAGAYSMTVAEAVDAMEQVSRDARRRPTSQ
jgi:hypothetical protein